MYGRPLYKAYRELGVTLTIVPFPTDLSASLDLAEKALRSRLAPGERFEDFWPEVSSEIRAGRLNGGLLREHHDTRGLATWQPAGPFGAAVRLLYLEPPRADAEGYRDALDAVSHAAGAFAFVTGQLSGLSEAEEASLLGGRGFAPFGRSEMAFPPVRPVPVAATPPGVRVRPVVAGDEPELARLHERAYWNHLDRYLATEDADPARDADRQLREYFAGRYGEVLSPGSSAVDLDGRIVAAVIATRRSPEALIIDVMSDPAHQRRGFARLALTDSVRALRERGEAKIILNVTEGNDPAVRLYTRLGFVRTIGPTREWYDARRLKVEQPRALAR